MKFGSPPSHVARRRFRLWTALVLLLALVLFIIGPRIYWRVQVNREIARIKAEGYPTTFKELHDFQPAVPDEDNMALILINAFAHLDREISDEEMKLIPFLGLRRSPSVHDPMTSEEIEASALLLERNKQALQLLHEAAGLKSSAFPSQSSPNQLHPYLKQLRTAQSLLALDAAVHTSAGKPDRAAASLFAMFQTARSLDNAHGLVTHAVRSALLRVALINLEAFVAVAELPASRIQMLRESIQSSMKSDPLAAMLVGERVNGIRIITREIAEFETAVAPDFGVMFGGTDTPPEERLLARIRFFLYRMGGFYNRDLMNHLETTRAWMQENRSGPPYLLQTTSKHETTVGIPLFLSEVLLGNIDKDVARMNESHRLLTAADAVLAVEQFRQETGEVPESLEALVPESLEAVPVDYESGKPMKILGTVNGFGVGVYSPLFQVRTNFIHRTLP